MRQPTAATTLIAAIAAVVVTTTTTAGAAAAFAPAAPASASASATIAPRPRPFQAATAPAYAPPPALTPRSSPLSLLPASENGGEQGLLMHRPHRRRAVTSSSAFFSGRGGNGLRTPGHAVVRNITPRRTGVIDRLNQIVESGAGSILLILMSSLSIVAANLPATGEPWMRFWDRALGPAIGEHQLTMKGWINEGLMAIFFFVVGLEIKKELVVGSLSSMRTALLPCIAALGGMIMPMLVYLAVNLFPGGTLQGWAIPMATDIAFAMGVYSFFKTRMPPSFSPFLLTLATVDDLGAIIVIALCFSKAISLPFLLGAVAVSALLTAMERNVSTRLPQYALLGTLLWYLLLRAGVNADIAGVVTAMAIPATRGLKVSKDPRKRRDMAIVADGNMIENLIHRIQPFSSLLIMPLFALANCAVPLSSPPNAADLSVHPMANTLAGAGVAAGLLLGKPLGIVGLTLLATKAKLGSLPIGMNPQHLTVVGVLGAIGFTMSIFLADVSLNGLLAQNAKIGIFLASVLAALFGSGYMLSFPKFNTSELFKRGNGTAIPPNPGLPAGA
mmetsp:Transcript_10175/g.25009  ORF Transcript_10175/g.25009 Transcript_10175/m.25009 type:complete len:559 (+) Transcript_10175:136-1812(+)